MNRFDEDYMKRREKQIKELYELRAMIWACLITAVIGALIAAGLLFAGFGTGALILLVISLLFGVGAVFMGASYVAEKGADQAIQKEYELLSLYTKPKRGGQEEIVRLSDDGELIVEDALADEAHYREGRAG